MTGVVRLGLCGLLLTTAACATAPGPTPQPVHARYVVERDVVVRRTANAGADEVGRLPAGTTVAAWVEDVGGNWIRIRSDSGNVGYVFGHPLHRAD